MFQVASRRCPSLACLAGGIALLALLCVGGAWPALAASPEDRDLAAGGRIEKITVREGRPGTEVVIRCDREIGGVAAPFVLSEPSRLVLELAGFHHNVPDNNIAVHNAAVDTVRLGNYSDRVRVVLVSPKSPFPAYDMKVEGKEIHLTIQGPMPLAETEAPVSVEPPAAPKTPEDRVQTIEVAPDPHRNTITGIKLGRVGDSSRLEIVATQDLDCDVFELSDKTLALSIGNTSLPENLRGRVNPEGEGAGGIAYADAYPSMDPAQKDARVILELSSDLPYKVVRGGKTLIVDVNTAPPPAPTEKAVTAAPPATEATPVSAAMMAAAEPAEAQQTGMLMEIGAVAEAGTTPADAPPAEATPPSGTVGAGAPAEAPFNPIASAPTAPAASTLPAVPAPPAPVPAAPPRKPAAEPKSATLVLPLPPPPVEAAAEVPIAEPGASFKTGFFEPPNKFTGTKISIDVQDAEIQNILRLIADISGLNMIISEAVTGRITIKLKNIPWDQALDIILKTKGLGQEREGTILRIAPYEQLDKEREREIAKRKQKEILDPPILKIIPVNFANSQDLLPKLQQIASKRDDVSLDTDARTNSLIIKDTEKIVSIMADLVRSLDTPTPQVLIEARIVEANINFSRQYGIQWGTGYVQSPQTGNATGKYFPNSWSIGGYPATSTTGGQATSLQGLVSGPSGNPLLVNMPAAVGTTGAALGLTLASIDDTLTLDIIISALEDTGQGKLISSPRVITIDNKQARIEQGFDIPFRTVSLEGAEVSFQSANLELSVTPHITPDESIVMKISVSNDAPDFSQTVEGNPLVSRKSADTEVLIRNGETAVIGGIFTVNNQFSRNAVPWFGDIPVLGLLFRRDSDINEKKELVVFITPTIIKRDTH